MDANLHVKQALNHLNKVLNYAPFVQADGHATVYLTREDWMVVADLLLYSEAPMDVLPSTIESYRMAESGQAIELTTADGTISVEMI